MFNQVERRFVVVMHGSSGYLIDIVFLLSAAVSVVGLLWHFRINATVGYFAAGALVGHHGLNLIQSANVVDSYAQLGVVFLLFIIGLELTFKKLLAMRTQVFGLGSVQLVLTAGLFWLFCRMFHIKSDTAMIVGAALAMSSTALALQIIQDKGIQSSKTGKLSVAILLMQDLAVVPLIVLVYVMSSSAGGDIVVPMLLAMLKTAVAMVLIFVTGRLLFRPMFDAIMVMHSTEIFIAATLLVVFGAAFVTDKFGLSMGLGAFIAGLIVAETEYRHEVEKAILPFKRLLLGLFFMTIGMSLNFKFIVQDLFMIALISISIIVVKAFVMALICTVAGMHRQVTIRTALLLSQGGEFGFVLFNIAKSNGLMTDDLLQIISTAITVTMILTPALDLLSVKLIKLLSKDQQQNPQGPVMDSFSGHTVIVGYGEVGRVATECLSGGQYECVVIDIKSRVIAEADKTLVHVHLGDATKLSTLHEVGMERANAAIITVSNEVTRHKIITTLTDHFHNVTIIARASSLEEANEAKEIGAHFAVSSYYETGLQLASTVLEAHGLSSTAIENIQSNYRRNSYTVLPNSASDDND